MFKRIKYFIQRGVRGYSDEDTWDAHYYLCKIIPPMVRNIKENSIGCPSDLYDESKKNDECWRWEEVLESIAQGFEAAIDLSFMKYMEFKDGKMQSNEERRKNLVKKYEEGISLFHDYFMALLD